MSKFCEFTIEKGMRVSAKIIGADGWFDGTSISDDYDIVIELDNGPVGTPLAHRHNLYAWLPLDVKSAMDAAIGHLFTPHAQMYWDKMTVLAKSHFDRSGGEEHFQEFIRDSA